MHIASWNNQMKGGEVAVLKFEGRGLDRSGGSRGWVEIEGSRV